MRTLLIACGALAREILHIRDINGWDVEVLALPAQLHNRPERIPETLRRRVEALRETYQRVLVVYGDCGTGGALDQVVQELGIERIPGPHCYEFFAGERFFDMMEEETGTFFLTDFLARSFRKLVYEGLGLDRHPELRDSYFGAYRRLVYLQQREDPGLIAAAHEAAGLLDLPLEIRFTGVSTLAARIEALAGPEGLPIESAAAAPTGTTN